MEDEGIIRAYRELAGVLTRYRAEAFPLGSTAEVDCPRYHGRGTVADYECPPDQLSVRLENGNVWWYPIDRCSPALL